MLVLFGKYNKTLLIYDKGKNNDTKYISQSVLSRLSIINTNIILRVKCVRGSAFTLALEVKGHRKSRM